MKIERGKKEIETFSTFAKTQRTAVNRQSASSFEQELDSRQEEIVRDRMSQIMQDIDKLTERLTRNTNINDLMLYKKLVKTFLQEASKKAFAVNRRRGRSRRGRTILVTIETIDQEIESMVMDFIQKKKEPLEILQTLDKIKGMLVDLMI